MALRSIGTCSLLRTQSPGGSDPLARRGPRSPIPSGTDCFLYELPGGHVSRDETPLEAARRELQGGDRLRRRGCDRRTHVAGCDDHPAQMGGGCNRVPKDRRAIPGSFGRVLRDGHSATPRVSSTSSVGAAHGRLGRLRGARSPWFAWSASGLMYDYLSRASR